MTRAKQIGPFQIEAELGRGSMSFVYEAVDTRASAFGATRRVALKVINASDYQVVELQARFRQEAAGALKVAGHPSIVTVFEVDVIDGMPYIVMELIPGPTLERVISPQDHETRPIPLTPELFRQVLLQTASALDFAHGKGVVHRDVKPANIMIHSELPLSLSGSVKILDFGIARMDWASAGLTLPGQAVGSPRYMSPEQASGMKSVPATDQYGLAVTAYHVLTQAFPIVVNDARNVDHLLRIVRTPPDDPAQYNAGLTPEIRDVLFRGLAKDTRQRFGNCVEFAEALVAALDRAPALQLPQAGHLQEAGQPEPKSAIAVPAPPFAPAPPDEKDEVETRRTVTPPEMFVRPPARRSKPWWLAAPIALFLLATFWFWPRATPVPGAGARPAPAFQPLPPLDAHVKLQRLGSTTASEVLFAIADGYLKIWKGTDWTSADRRPVPIPRGIHTAAVSGDGELAAWPSADSRPELVSAADPSSVGALGKATDRHQGEILAIAFGRDGRLLYTASSDGDIRQWDVANRSLSTVRNPPDGQRTALTSLAISVQGTIAAGAGPRVLVWPADSSSANVLSAPAGESVGAVAFDPAGRTILAASGKRVLLWRLAALLCLPGCNQSLGDPVTAVAADSHDFVYAASGSRIFWWHLYNGTPDNSGTFDPAQPGLQSLAIVGSGATELLASEDETSIRLWRVQ